MNKKLMALAHRRRLLVEKIRSQRMDAAGIIEDWRKPLALADTALDVVQAMRRHPAWLTAGLTALLAWRRTGVFGLAKASARLLILYPSALVLGLKFLSRSAHSKHQTSSDQAPH